MCAYICIYLLLSSEKLVILHTFLTGFAYKVKVNKPEKIILIAQVHANIQFCLIVVKNILSDRYLDRSTTTTTKQRKKIKSKTHTTIKNIFML